MDNGLIDRGVWSLPVCADTLFNVGQYFKDESNSKCQKYEKCSVAIISDQALKDNVESAVQRLAQQFVGSIVDFDFCKIYITSLDAFVHLGDDHDDCANATSNSDNTVFAKIREKANYKHSSYEVSIYLGSIELLAIGGVVVFDEAKSVGCFLGSSVKPLLTVMSPSKNTVSREIYVKKEADEVVRSERLLRQYYKEHPLYSNNDSSLASQSINFKAFALRSVFGFDSQEAMGRFKASRPVKNMKESNVFAKIREKANYKHSSYEVSIFVGSVELLAIGGVVPLGEDRPASCFLGSSVKPLLAVMSPSKNTVSKEIYVSKQCGGVIQSERLLRQYYKVHAGKKWSFHLKSLAGLGFLPLNPLRVTEHPLCNSDDTKCPSNSRGFARQ